MWRLRPVELTAVFVGPKYQEMHGLCGFKCILK